MTKIEGDYHYGGSGLNMVRVGGVTVGAPRGALVLIAGPDVIESERHCLRHAERMRAIADRVGVPFIFKCSYDKANRSSHRSFRGPGWRKGLPILAKVHREVGVPVLSDVHCPEEIAPAAEVLDVMQVPAFLCRQTDFVMAVAKTGRVVNVKKGQFLAPWDMRNVVEKVVAAGNRRILLTERGASFGYNNLVSDLRALPVLRELGYPVIYDATHSVQLPGGLGDRSGGQRQFVIGLARAGVAMGCDGLFLEVHEDPDHAPCDGPNMLPLRQLETLLRQVTAIQAAVRQTDRPRRGRS